VRWAAGIALLLGTGCTLRFDRALLDGGAGADGADGSCPSERVIAISDLVDFSIAPTGDGLAMIWSTWDGAGPITEAHFARYDPGGSRIGDIGTIATSTVGIDLLPGGLAFTGDGFGVLWKEQERFGVLRLTRLDAGGAPIGDPVTVPGAEEQAESGALVWVEDGYAALWRHSQDNYDLFASRLEPDGVGAAPNLLGLDPQDVAVAYRPGEVGAAVIDESVASRIVVLRLDRAGSALGPEVELAADREYPAEVRIAASDSGYGVVWSDGPFTPGGRRVYFAAVDASGTPLGPAVPVSDAPGDARLPALAWVGSRFVVAWSDDRHENDEVYARAFDAAGAPLGDEVRLTFTPTESWAWDVVAGERTIVVWTEANELRLTLLCPGAPP
jgi:hypothetical protein